MKKLRRTLVGLAACSCMLLAAGAARVAVLAAPPDAAATCSGGTIAPGTYHSLTVTGICSLPDAGVVTVRGGLTIAPNALLNAGTPATLDVSGGVSVENGGAFLLGCSLEVAPSCATPTSDRIDGGVQADQPLALILHNNTINGGVSLQGGGGGVNCHASAVLMGSPVFSTLEDNTVHGGVSVAGLQSCWFGFIRNRVDGTVTIANSTFADPDAPEIVTNMVRGNLDCSGNSPAPHIGDSMGQQNVVTGQATGQCTPPLPIGASG